MVITPLPVMEAEKSFLLFHHSVIEVTVPKFEVYPAGLDELYGV
jgi:hypothetical protein